MNGEWERKKMDWKIRIKKADMRGEKKHLAYYCNMRQILRSSSSSVSGKISITKKNIKKKLQECGTARASSIITYFSHAHNSLNSNWMIDLVFMPPHNIFCRRSEKNLMTMTMHAQTNQSSTHNWSINSVINYCASNCRSVAPYQLMK